MKKIIALIIGILITLPLVMGTAFAADDDFCAKFSTQGQEGFYVILEEPIGGPDAHYCFRVCRSNLKEKVVSKNVCKIKSICETDADLGGDAKNITCQYIQILEARSGIDLLSQYIKLIYLWAAGTIGIIAVLTIVISGVQIMASGQSGNIETAKTRITQSLVGLIVLFLSGLILYTINPNFFV